MSILITSQHFETIPAETKTSIHTDAKRSMPQKQYSNTVKSEQRGYKASRQNVPWNEIKVERRFLRASEATGDPWDYLLSSPTTTYKVSWFKYFRITSKTLPCCYRLTCKITTTGTSKVLAFNQKRRVIRNLALNNSLHGLGILLLDSNAAISTLWEEDSDYIYCLLAQKGASKLNFNAVFWKAQWNTLFQGYSAQDQHSN